MTRAKWKTTVINTDVYTKLLNTKTLSKSQLIIQGSNILVKDFETIKLQNKNLLAKISPTKISKPMLGYKFGCFFRTR